MVINQTIGKMICLNEIQCLMSYRLITCLFLLFISYLPGILQAQELGDTVRVETMSRQVFIGELTYQDDEEISIYSETVGQITIKRLNVHSIKKVDPSRIKNGKFWYENPQATRYFFAPNAIGLRNGRGYYQNTWVLFNNASYGISNHFSIGGGMIPLFLFGTSETPVWLLPKVSVPISENRFYLGAGAMVGGVIGEETDPLGIFYGSATVGNRDDNISVSIGYGYAGGSVSDTPLLNISGMKRIARRFYLITENYFVPGTEAAGILSIGGRWSSESFGLDFGLFRPTGDVDDFVGVPWLSVTIPFGKN